MIIYWHCYYGDYSLINFLNNFRNLYDLTIEKKEIGFENILGSPTIKIKESPNSKIKKISTCLTRHMYNIEVIIGPYEKMEYIDLYSDISNFNELPFFQENNSRKFNSLKYFSFNCRIGFELTKNLLENLYNNIDNMPNLKEFRLLYYSGDDVDINFFKNFVRKVLSLKLIKIIYISNNRLEYIWFDSYNYDEIKELFPDINLNKYYKISLRYEK